MERACGREPSARTSARSSRFLMHCTGHGPAGFRLGHRPEGLPVILPALAGAGILVFLSQLFVPNTKG